MKNSKRTICLILALLLIGVFALSGCGKNGADESQNANEKIADAVKTDDTASGKKVADSAADDGEPAGESKAAASAAAPTTTTGRAVVAFTMQDGGTFKMELYPEYAPKTVENFLKLVNEGFYDGLTFHRVYEGFMAQGGDPEGTGSGGSDETIPGEFASNGFTQNTLSHTRGVVSMARSGDPNSASSQFFICYTDDSTFLDGNYAAFGKVIEGMEVVDAFTKVEMSYNPTDGRNTTPVTPIVIDHAEVVG